MKTPESPKYTGVWHGAVFVDGMSPGIVIKAEEPVAEVKEVSDKRSETKYQHWMRSIVHHSGHKRGGRCW